MRTTALTVLVAPAARATGAARRRAPFARKICLATTASMATLFATAAFADTKDGLDFELTALLGYRAGGDFDATTGAENPNIEPNASYGIMLGWLADANTKYELLYDLQRSEIQDSNIDLDVEHLHLGGTVGYGGTNELAPYLSGGLGATRLRPAEGEDETRFSMSLALGVGIPVGERIGLRFEVRGYLVSMDSDSAIFCSSGPVGGSCLVRAAGDTLFQYAVIGGIGLKF